jgi:hypothetical protein
MAVNQTLIGTFATVTMNSSRRIRRKSVRRWKTVTFPMKTGKASVACTSQLLDLVDSPQDKDGNRPDRPKAPRKKKAAAEKDETSEKEDKEPM